MRERQCVCRGAAPCWDLSVCGVTSLLLRQVSMWLIAMRNFTMRAKRKGTCLTFLRDKKCRSMFSSSAQMAEMCAQAKEVIESGVICSGEEGKKRAYPSSGWQSYKEMTEHKRSMQPNMINNERRSLEALNQCKSRPFAV